jgi:hypothetical protein
VWAAIFKCAHKSVFVAPQHNRLVANIDIDRLVSGHFLGSGYRPPDILRHRESRCFCYQDIKLTDDNL